MFLSQGEPGERLSRFAALDHDWEVTYKLHPGEYSRWRDEYLWLEDVPVQVVDSDSPSLYELFGRSTGQVGAYSTALYEGLYFVLDTYVVDVPGIECVRGLIDAGGADLVRTPEGLAGRLRSSSVNVDVDLDRFSCPGADATFASALREIRAENGD